MPTKPIWPVSNAAAALLLAVVLCAPSAHAGSEADPDLAPRPDGFSLLRADSPIGVIDYVAGRGLRIGDTGLTIGGFLTVEAERLEEDGGQSVGGLEGVNSFLFFDPSPYLHVFSEIEAANLAASMSDAEGGRSDPAVEVDRLYADLTPNDLVNVRFGKFLTPIGRWNQAPAEPLVWTTSEPLIVEEVFDETVSGAMVHGTAFPGGGALAYSLYGTFLDPIAPDRQAPPADHAAGARLEWSSLDGWSIGVSYFASEAQRGLGAADDGEDPIDPGDGLDLSDPADPGAPDEPLDPEDERDVELGSLERSARYGRAIKAGPFSRSAERGWNHLGGIDFLWQPHERIELSGEALAGEGTRRNGGLRGVFVQGVFELAPTLHGVGRFEHFDPPGRARGLEIFDIGLTWVPAYSVRVKADYRLLDGRDDDRIAEPGFRSSFSLLF